MCRPIRKKARFLAAKTLSVFPRTRGAHELRCTKAGAKKPAHGGLFGA